jgi:hypothetical protein
MDKVQPTTSDQPFDINRATIVVETDDDAAVARAAFSQRVVVHGAIPIGALTGPVLVLARKQGFEKMRELIDAGADRDTVRFYDFGAILPSLSQLLSSAPNLLEAISSELGHCLWDKVRPLHMWSTDDAMDIIEKGDTALGDHLLWRFPSLVVSCGGYGSGKSTFAQILAFKLLTSPEGIMRELKMSLRGGLTKLNRALSRISA